MVDKARRLNERGIEGFQNYINELSNDGSILVPSHLLSDNRYSEELDIDIEIENKVFDTRYTFGAYLTEILKNVDIHSILGDQGFWSWLALYWFDQLCPLDGKGNRKPSRPYNYVLSSNYNHRPRHAVYTTWMLVEKYGEDSRFLLSKKLNERGELIEQLAARQYLITCEGVIKTASKLYYDSDRKTFKRGSTSQKRKGNVRRFVAYLQQLDLTYDLGSIDSGSLLEMMPEEYSAFKENVAV